MLFCFFFNDTANTEIYTLSLHDALPIYNRGAAWATRYEKRLFSFALPTNPTPDTCLRSEEHTSELQSQSNLVCRLLLEKKKKNVRTPVTSLSRMSSSSRIKILHLSCNNL